MVSSLIFDLTVPSRPFQRCSVINTYTEFVFEVSAYAIKYSMHSSALPQLKLQITEKIALRTQGRFKIVLLLTRTRTVPPKYDLHFLSSCDSALSWFL